MLTKESHERKWDNLYNVKRKGYKLAVEEFKQQIKAEGATLKQYTNTVKQYQ